MAAIPLGRRSVGRSSAALGGNVLAVIEEGESRLRADLHAEIDRIYDDGT